jgi:hypothetical protein
VNIAQTACRQQTSAKPSHGRIRRYDRQEWTGSLRRDAKASQRKSFLPATTRGAQRCAETCRAQSNLLVLPGPRSLSQLRTRCAGTVRHLGRVDTIRTAAGACYQLDQASTAWQLADCWHSRAHQVSTRRPRTPPASSFWCASAAWWAGRVSATGVLSTPASTRSRSSPRTSWRVV